MKSRLLSFRTLLLLYDLERKKQQQKLIQKTITRKKMCRGRTFSVTNQICTTTAEYIISSRLLFTSWTIRREEETHTFIHSAHISRTLAILCMDSQSVCMLLNLSVLAPFELSPFIQLLEKNLSLQRQM